MALRLPPQGNGQVLNPAVQRAGRSLRQSKLSSSFSLPLPSLTSPWAVFFPAMLDVYLGYIMERATDSLPVHAKFTPLISSTIDLDTGS